MSLLELGIGERFLPDELFLPQFEPGRIIEPGDKELELERFYRSLGHIAGYDGRFGSSHREKYQWFCRYYPSSRWRIIGSQFVELLDREESRPIEEVFFLEGWQGRLGLRRVDRVHYPLLLSTLMEFTPQKQVDFVEVGNLAFYHANQEEKKAVKEKVEPLLADLLIVHLADPGLLAEELGRIGLQPLYLWLGEKWPSDTFLACCCPSVRDLVARLTEEKQQWSNEQERKAKERLVRAREKLTAFKAGVPQLEPVG